MLIDLDKAQAGMEICQDVHHPDEGLLVKSPMVLSDHLIDTLKKYHIQRIHIKNIDQTAHAPPPGNEADGQAHAAAPEVAVHHPAIVISPSRDKMSANMHIEPRGQANETLTAGDIIEALAEKGIVFGIDHEVISQAVASWQKAKKTYLFKNIAQGTAPIAGHDGGLEFTVKHLSQATELERVRGVSHAWELTSDKLSLQRARKNTLVAHKTNPKPPQPGQDIFGRTMETNERVKVAIGCGENIETRRDETEFYALEDGLAYWIDGKLGVTPLNFNGSAEVIVGQDAMHADLLLHPAVDGGAPPSYDDVFHLIKENNILWGIDIELIKQTLKQAAVGAYPHEPLTFATGLVPVAGENGRVEYLFNTQTSLKPRSNKDGSVDFKNVELIQPVAAGKELARLIPPVQGTPGRDITGRELSATNGTPATLPMGPNTTPSPTNPNLLIAAVDGNVGYKGKLIEVTEGYVIKGDVDFSTGNVAYEKSVSVGGDVKAGFSVDCGGDLQVAGTIEDASINVKGTVLCKHGFVGHGQGVLEARGDVNISFTHNKTIRSHGIVTIAHEAINSTILARAAIILEGNPLSAVGGTFCARDYLTAKTIGNLNGTKTILEVGTDFLMAEELSKTEAAMDGNEKNLEKLAESSQKYEHLLHAKKSLTAQDAYIYTKIKEMILKLGQEASDLEQRKKMIIEKMHSTDNAYITIHHAAYPGTFIKFGPRQHIIREEVVGPKTIRLVQQEIRIY
jgi:uncharacterized protein (DUF342 family)